MIIMMIIENDNNDSDNDSDNDDKNYNTSDNDEIMIMMIIMRYRRIPLTRTKMLSFDITVVESENNSRVSGNLRRHVAHITSL